MDQCGPGRCQAVPGWLQVCAGVQEHAHQTKWQCGPPVQYLGRHSQVPCLEKTLDWLLDGRSSGLLAVHFRMMNFSFLQEFMGAQSST